MQVCCVFKDGDLVKIFRTETDGKSYIRDERDRRKDRHFKPNYWIEMRSVEEY